MFTLEHFTGACRVALKADDPVEAICALVEEAVAEPEAIAQALEKAQPGGAQAGAMIHQSDDLTIVHVVAAPGFVSPVHDHTIWAVVGQYMGQEDNTFYEERDGDLVQVGAQSICAGEVVPLNNKTIHAIRNASTEEPCRALHVYGGDLLGANRSFWEPESGEKKSAKTGDFQAAIERLNAPS